MALNLNDVLTNREQYPDTQEIEFMGQKMTLKDLRGELIPKGDMTRATQRLSDEKRQLESNVTELQQAYQGLQGQLATMMQARTGGTAEPGKTPLADLEADPLMGPIIAELRAVRGELSKAVESNTRLEQQQQQMATHYLQDQYRSRIAALQAKDATLNPKALVDFAVSHNMPDIEAAYQLMTQDTRFKQIEADAEKRGYEKGKQEVVSAPPISVGRRMGVPPPPEGVTTVSEARNAAKQDPEIARLWSGTAP